MLKFQVRDLVSTNLTNTKWHGLVGEVVFIGSTTFSGNTVPIYHVTYGEATLRHGFQKPIVFLDFQLDPVEAVIPILLKRLSFDLYLRC